MKKEDHLDRYANLEKRDSSERSGLRMPPPDGDGCKKTSFGVSLTKGDASASAAGSDPCGSEGGCSRSGDPGCVCATGIWGGEIACTCIQVWNCTGSVCCLPQ